MEAETKGMTIKRLSEEIDVLKDKLKETTELFKGKIRELEKNLQELVNAAENKEDILEPIDIKKTRTKNPDKVKRSYSLLKCNLCEMKFTRFCDLECHLKANHKKCKEFECDTCRKTFVTNWRLRKHERIHSEKNTKPCHYFTDKVDCPFEDLGCKFVHVFPESFSQNSGDTIDDALKKDFVVDSRDMRNSFDNTEEIEVISSFLTSTPKRHPKKCEGCLEDWECVDCLIKNTLSEQRDKRMKLF